MRGVSRDEGKLDHILVALTERSGHHQCVFFLLNIKVWTALYSGHNHWVFPANEAKLIYS